MITSELSRHVTYNQSFNHHVELSTSALDSARNSDNIQIHYFNKCIISCFRFYSTLGFNLTKFELFYTNLYKEEIIACIFFYDWGQMFLMQKVWKFNMHEKIGSSSVCSKVSEWRNKVIWLSWNYWEVNKKRHRTCLLIELVKLYHTKVRNYSKFCATYLRNYFQVLF